MIIFMWTQKNILSHFLPISEWKNVISRMKWECFCSCLSTCIQQYWSLAAVRVIIGSLKEQDLRLVTNLTKLSLLGCRAQQPPTLWLVAIMLRIPTGKGHKGERRQALETVAEPTTHPWALWGWRDNNPGSIKVWLMPFLLSLMTGCLACGSLRIAGLYCGTGTDRPTAGC